MSTTEHNVWIGAEPEYDLYAVVLNCEPCQFEQNLGVAVDWRDVVTAVEQHLGEPVKCQSLWQKKMGMAPFHCQLFNSHDGWHEYKDGEFKAEWP